MPGTGKASSREVSFRHILTAVLLVPVLFSACKEESKQSAAANAKSANKPVSASVFVARRQALSTPIEVQGTVVAKEFVEIRPEISGRLVYENIRDGAQVAAGTVLARINDDDLQAQLGKTQSQLTIAKQNLGRIQQLVDRNGASQLELDNARNQVNTLEADIQLSRVAISKTVIRAPFAGKLGFKLVSRGAYVSPSTLLATLTQTQPMLVQFTVPEKYITRMRIGQSVQVTVPDQDQPIEATVQALDPNIDANSRSLSVRAQLRKIPPGTQPGVSAKVQYILRQEDDAILVPSQCVIPEARGKKVLLLKGGKAQSVTVETGWRNEKSVQILSGVEAGDSVIATSIMQIRPDMPVLVSNTIQ